LGWTATRKKGKKGRGLGDKSVWGIHATKKIIRGKKRKDQVILTRDMCLTTRHKQERNRPGVISWEPLPLRAKVTWNGGGKTRAVRRGFGGDRIAGCRVEWKSLRYGRNARKAMGMGRHKEGDDGSKGEP